MWTELIPETKKCREGIRNLISATNEFKFGTATVTFQSSGNDVTDDKFEAIKKSYEHFLWNDLAQNVYYTWNGKLALSELQLYS